MESMFVYGRHVFLFRFKKQKAPFGCFLFAVFKMLLSRFFTTTRTGTICTFVFVVAGLANCWFWGVCVHMFLNRRISSSVMKPVSRVWDYSRYLE